jgi:LysR family hydrogen peroxide-inducible transcriptional activator
MTLTELKYIVAVARERHFGKAAEACFVSQPTLSVAVKKLEEELEVKLFERSANEVAVTALGEEIVRQAQSVLEQAAAIREMAKRGKSPLNTALTLGVIYTISPYLLPDLMRQLMVRTPQMPLMLQENFTVKLLDMLRTGEIDCAILAEPFPDAGLAIAPLYDEPFLAAGPAGHRLAKQEQVTIEELKQEPMLLLGSGHCFRDHVLEVCPEFARFSSNTDGIRKAFEGSSLETIKHMVAAGMGVTLVPRLSVPKEALAGKPRRKRDEEPHIKYLPFAGDPPTRRVVLAWRRSFTRYEAIAALRNAIYACELPGVTRLSGAATSERPEVATVSLSGFDSLESPRWLAAAALADTERPVGCVQRLSGLASAAGVHPGHHPDAQCRLLYQRRCRPRVRPACQTYRGAPGDHRRGVGQRGFVARCRAGAAGLCLGLDDQRRHHCLVVCGTADDSLLPLCQTLCFDAAGRAGGGLQFRHPDGLLCRAGARRLEFGGHARQRALAGLGFAAGQFVLGLGL